MLIVEIDGIDPEPLERSLGDLLDVLRPAIEPTHRGLPSGSQVEAELGGDDHLPAERSERFAHEFFVDERSVDFGGVEERDAAFDGGTDTADHFLLVFGRAVGPKLIPMQPSPMAETSRLPFPSLRFCIFLIL